VDKSLNRSNYSNEAPASLSLQPELVVRYPFDANIQDSTANLNHASVYGSIVYGTGKVGSNALTLNGSNSFLQLPSTIANCKDMTISTWVYWNGITTGQRIFDFGNGSNEYLYLTPRAALAGMRFGIKNNGTEQQLNTTVLPTYKWVHLAVTMGASGVSLYVNGVLATSSNTMTIRPSDFKPCLNYIGRSQSTYPLFYGMLDDFRIYNYALNAGEVADLAGTTSDLSKASTQFSIYPNPVSDIVQIQYEHSEPSLLQIVQLNGSCVMSKKITHSESVDVKSLPTGLYMVRLTNRDASYVRKLTVRR
jgi:hypothetical protein